MRRRPAGLFYGVQTLRQLLPAAIEAPRRQPGPWELGDARSTTARASRWRGAMLDVARHFFGVAEVKRHIDLMALYKLNRLHLHLTDDQGWRIEIRSWPKLARDGGSTAVGGGPGGYYTQARVRGARRATRASRYITIVPEIDMPGHTNAALAVLRGAELRRHRARRCTPGIDVGFSSLCIGKEMTYTFVDDVVGELAALTPGPVPPHRRRRGRSDRPRATTATSSSACSGIVRAHGKQPIGWDEIARGRACRATPSCSTGHDLGRARAAGRRAGREGRSCRPASRRTST